MAQAILDPDDEDLEMLIAGMKYYEPEDQFGFFDGFIAIRQAIGFFNLWMLPEGKLNESWKKTAKESTGGGKSVRAKRHAHAAPR